MILFHVISAIVCIITYFNLRKERCQQNTLKSFEITNWVVMILLCVTEIFSLLVMPYLFILSIILIIPTIALTIWHIKLIKNIHVLKVKIIQQSVIYCNNCGTALKTGTEFCVKCGSKMEVK